MKRSHETAVLRCAVLILAAASGAPSGAQPAPAAAPPRHEVAIEAGVPVKMRDGVTLVADVYRPKTPGRFPVLLKRTPYDRRETDTGTALASRGYIVILQDTRGRFDSGGEFYPFLHESEDGYDTVEWAAALDGSSGVVGMFGVSYEGATQMLAAIARPPHLRAVLPFVTASEYYDGWTYQGGAWMQNFSSTWATGLALDTLRRKTERASYSNLGERLKQLPVTDYQPLAPPPAADVAPYFRDWVEHERDDEYWRRWKVSDHHAKLDIKALHGGGWHDIFLKGSIANYVGMRRGAARNDQRLVIGPWAHAPTSPDGKVGDVTFGAQAALDLNDLVVRWMDYALKGVKNEFAGDAPVRIFVMGDNVWRSEKEFPLARTRYTRYFLHSAGAANTAAGDGTLAASAPAAEKPDAFEYDPADPVPTIGGRLCCGGTQPGPFNQQPSESRRDVLVFSTPPLARDVEVTGYVTVELYAASSAVDTDFTALLADVDAAGYARFLTDGIIRARYRSSTASAAPIEPGRPYKYTIDLWATSNVFKAGHRIRLYVSSSNFPRFNRNLNTGEPIAKATRMVKARQTILHDARHPSALVLPVIPRPRPRPRPR